MGKDKQKAIKSVHKMMWRGERVETWALPPAEAVDAAVQESTWSAVQRCSRLWEICSTALPVISLFSRFRKYP